MGVNYSINSKIELLAGIHKGFSPPGPGSNESEEIKPEESRKKASIFLIKLENMMYNNYLFGNHPSLADMAILPFVRQFANTDFEWFEKQNWQNVKKWLNTFISSEIFNRIQIKYDRWSNLSKPQFFPN